MPPIAADKTYIQISWDTHIFYTSFCVYSECYTSLDTRYLFGVSWLADSNLIGLRAKDGSSNNAAVTGKQDLDDFT